MKLNVALAVLFASVDVEVGVWVDHRPTFLVVHVDLVLVDFHEGVLLGLVCLVGEVLILVGSAVRLVVGVCRVVGCVEVV